MLVVFIVIVLSAVLATVIYYKKTRRNTDVNENIDRDVQAFDNPLYQGQSGLNQEMNHRSVGYENMAAPVNEDFNSFDNNPSELTKQEEDNINENKEIGNDDEYLTIN